MAIEADDALKAADAADAALAKGNVRGALHGVPLAHKDMYYDAGKVVTCGSKIRARLRRHRDRDGAAAAEGRRHGPARLAQDGGIRLRADRPQRALRPLPNPWDVDHVTGGSSSGSGAAVAARLTFAALGSDTGGSIRLPAHFCGVAGLKTTVGRVSRAGAVPLSQSLDTVGPLARTVEDCALLLGLMAGADPEDPTAIEGRCRTTWPRRSELDQGLTIGVPTAFYVDDLDPEVARILDETLAVAEARGRRHRPGRIAGAAPAHRGVPVRARDRSRRLSQAMDDRTAADYGAQVLMRLQNGLAIPGVSYLEAMRWRGPALAAHLAAVAGVDAVIAPVAPVAAPTIAESDVGNSPDAEP